MITSKPQDIIDEENNQTALAQAQAVQTPTPPSATETPQVIEQSAVAGQPSIQNVQIDPQPHDTVMSTANTDGTAPQSNHFTHPAPSASTSPTKQGQVTPTVPR